MMLHPLEINSKPEKKANSNIFERLAWFMLRTHQERGIIKTIHRVGDFSNNRISVPIYYIIDNINQLEKWYKGQINMHGNSLQK